METTTQIREAAVSTAKPVSKAAVFQRIFEKVCEQLNFNERERQWFRQLLAEELKQD